MLNSREYLTYTQSQLENLVKNGLADYTHGKKYQSIKGVMVLYLNFFTIQYDVATYSLATQKIVLEQLWPKIYSLFDLPHSPNTIHPRQKQL